MQEELQEKIPAGDRDAADAGHFAGAEAASEDEFLPKHGGAGSHSGLLKNIRIGIRLAFFRRINPSELMATQGGFVALALFDLFLHLVLSFARIGPDGYFSFQYFPYGIAHIPLILLAGFLIGRLARREDLTLPIATACLATGIPIGLAAELVNVIPEAGRLLGGVFSPDFDHFHPFFGWWALSVLVAILRMARLPRFRRFAALAVFAVTLLIPLWSFPRGELWSESDAESTAETVGAGSEEVIYRQPELLKSALERIKPGRKGVEDLYFIGFAGDGSQDVFRKELEVIGSIVRSRFDVAGRSLMLVNNPATLLNYPIATATSLERGLVRVGQVMDRDEDILLLYLTSHGSEDHHLAAELQPLTLNDIDPDMLMRMLDESGIRWRIIVVSACYSGAFVDSLKNDDTLVMTASDATSSSFGCGNDSDFTWFGKALFDEQLRRTFSFTEAFSKASRSLAARETGEGEEPSHPQIFVGKGIAPRLKQLEERLEGIDRERKRLPPQAGDGA